MIVTFLLHMLSFVRSFLYYIFLIFWTFTFPILMFPLALLSKNVARRTMCVWCYVSVKVLYLICGVKLSVTGQKHLPKPPFIVASKHQSGIETWFFQYYFGNPIFVFKKELLKIPVFGWYLYIAKMVYIDRKSGFTAIKKMAREISFNLRHKRVAVIFPEGSRSLPLQDVKYKAGIAILHALNRNIPIVPVALNSGMLWPKNSFIIKPGKIVIKFLEPIIANLDKVALMEELHRVIEYHSSELVLKKIHD